MRVAYLLTWPNGHRTGVFKKVIDQVSTWRKQGVDGALFVATSPSSAPDWKSQPAVVAVETFRNHIQSFSVQRRLVKAILDWNPDVTYVRTSPRHASVQGLFSQINHVVEIQTNDLVESKQRSYPHHLLTLASRRACLQQASGLVFVSRELSQLPSFSTFTATRTVIGNGIDLNRFTTLPAPRNEHPRLAFMGSPSIPWHGLDDILRLAQLRPSWSFDVIGPQLKARDTPPNVFTYGELLESQYRPILGQADAAISTLAWHLNDMNEASPLKSREYFAMGLPVIGGYKDTDISGESEIYLRLENRPLAILDAVADVEAFIKNWRGRRVQHDQIYFLDSDYKERRRLAFFDSVL